MNDDMRSLLCLALPRLYERLCGEKSLVDDETDWKLAHSSGEFTRK
jgi:hypothetical protein